MKTSRFILAAGFLLALALTLSCSDDDSGGGIGACKYTTDFTHTPIEVCDEVSLDDDDDEKEECKDMGGKYSDSCPSGYKFKCKFYDNSDDVTYFYTDLFTDCADVCKQEPGFCK